MLWAFEAIQAQVARFDPPLAYPGVSLFADQGI